MSYLLIKCQKSHRFQSKQIFQVISVKLTFTLFSISFANQEISVETEIHLRQFKKNHKEALKYFRFLIRIPLVPMLIIYMQKKIRIVHRCSYILGILSFLCC